MSTPKPAVLLDNARTERDRLAETAAQWHATAAAQRAEADDLEARLGDDVLAAGRDGPKVAGQLSTKLGELRTSAETARRTAEAADRQVPEQRRQMVRAAAAMVAERAVKARGKADEQRTKVDRLLGQLHDLEQCGYVPDKPAPPRDLVPGPGPVTYRLPRSEVLDRDAARLEARAAEIDQLADADDLEPATVERVVAEAFPESPEAQTVADRKAEDEQAEAERRERAEIEGARNRERKAKLRDVGLSYSGEITRERFVELYADKVARNERLDHEQAQARAVAEADRCDQRAQPQPAPTKPAVNVGSDT